MTTTASLPRSSAASPLRRRLAGMDWWLTASAACLSLLGCALIASAGAGTVGSAEAKKQVLAFLAAVVLAYGLTTAEPRSLQAWAPVLYLAALAFMLAVFTPLGVTIGGARAWVGLPLGFTLQPSEFAKLALIVILAATLASGGGAVGGNDRVVPALGLAAVPLGIVLLGNDTGSGLIMAGTVAVILLVAGVSWRWLAGLTVGGVAILVIAISTGLLAEYQMQRLLTFLNPGSDPYGAGLNTIQARIAVGGGGWFGHGLFAGPQTQGDFVPVNESDFVFTVAAEELGLLGGLLLLALFAVVLWRALRIAFDARDVFGRLVATGVAAWFALQMFENVGMNLGIMPVTGVTLPFVSYGGSSMLAAWVGIGLLQQVRLRSVG